MNAIARLGPAAQGAASGRTPVLAYLCDDETTELVCRVVPGGRRGVEVHDGGVIAARASIESGAVAEILLVDVTGASDPAGDVAALAAVCGAGTTIIALGPANDVTLYRSLIAAGAADYLVKPLVAQELRRTILTASGSPHHPTQPAKTGRVIVVVGARGGVGGSTVAVGLACLLADDLKRNVALIDLDLHFGTAALSLDIQPGTGLRNALNSPDRIDSLFIASALVRVNEHLHVMSGEEAVDEHLSIRPEALERLVGEARPIFDLTVIDLPRHLLAAAGPVLRQAQGLAVVCDLTLPALRDVLRIRSALARLAPAMTPLIVGNRVGARRPGELTAAEFERGLAAKIDIRIPEDPVTAKAGLAGKAGLKGRSGEVLRQLATTLSGIEKPADARGWFGRRR